jgi:hypothetical protein
MLLDAKSIHISIINLSLFVRSLSHVETQLDADLIGMVKGVVVKFPTTMFILYLFMDT